MTADQCVFCLQPTEGELFANDLVYARWDGYPVSPGHALIIPKRHVVDWFAASPAERSALTAAIGDVKAAVEQRYRPDGYNVGMNLGRAAGQTIFHLHVHVIPRYAGDVPDPRGGVRHVLPATANYLDAAQSRAFELAPVGSLPHGRKLVTGGQDDPLLAHLVSHLDYATAVDIAVAFTLTSGVVLLEPYLRDVLDREGRVRVLTGDYLAVSEPDALLRLTGLLGETPSGRPRNIELKIFESQGLSFHPKSYIVWRGENAGAAFVGSSNLSQTALRLGVEWNVRVIGSPGSTGFSDVASGFEALWNHPRTRPLDAEWITAYRQRRPQVVISPVGVPPEPPPPVPVPHEVQREALDALRRSRAGGASAGLVVLATGLGKTWLSAFDCNSPEFRRVLFVAHREEILGQAMQNYRAIRPSAILGLYTGERKTAGADVLFASIQTLSKRTHLDRFDPHHFDYIVIDEFHHAAAPTYRRLIEHFKPQFLLGLTATPERTDGGDLLALCGENLIYRCDLVDGIRRGLLCPFDYYGVPDLVNYENIPWRSTRFDEEALTQAVATQARAENALEQYRKRAGSRTIGFCVSQRHADFMRDYFIEAGLRAAAVHSGPGSDPRSHTLVSLESGELDVVFAVDMFNEGVDLPSVDTIMMLRPTESQILWLQQFGRGLRVQPGKRLQVVDYIGNHRIFLTKPRTLLQLGAGDAEVAYALQALQEGTLELPPGCSVTYELEAKDILTSLLRDSPPGERLRDYYEDFRERHGMRPTAVEAFHDGYDPKSARMSYGSWFGFVQAMGDLSSAQVVVQQRIGDFLGVLETTPMTKSFKMVLLLAMLEEDALPGSVPLARLGSRFAELARRYAIVRTELGEAIDDTAQLNTLLVENPIRAWIEGRGTGGTQYFRVRGNAFETTFNVPADARTAAREMVRELAEWRLGVYLRRVGFAANADRIVCRVSHAESRPILFLPPRERTAGIPEGWVDVVADGVSYQAKFAKVAINVMQRVGGTDNVLGDVLRQWFGPNAGQPGTTHTVELLRDGNTYTLSPGVGAIEHGPQLWKTYVRAEVPKLFGFEFKGFESQSGVVERDSLILLFVTLDKSGKPTEHQYEDKFVSAERFRWQSQNRTRRESEAGRRIAQHRERNIAVQLFVRPVAKAGGITQPFIYCGPLQFEAWEGDQPITVTWTLRTPVPERLLPVLRVGA